MPSTTHRRPGQASLAALIALPLMLGTLILVVFLFRTRDSLIELRSAGVATSLAAAEDLVDDGMLTGDPDRIRPRLDRARQSADTVARQNLVEGRRLTLSLTDSDSGPGDVVFGVLDRAVGGRFERFDPAKASATDWGRVNAVEVTVRQPNKPSVITRVTAVLDGAVIGFKPWPGKPAPVVPVALFDAPPTEADHPTWSGQLAAKRDEWKLEHAPWRFKPGADGIPEVKVLVGQQDGAGADEVCGFPLILGSRTPAEAIQQVRTGVTDEAVVQMGGGFQIGSDGVLVANGDPGLYRTTGSEKQTDTAEAAFRALAASGEARVWPMFGAFDANGRAAVTGFTAARVVAVEPRANGTLLLTLQPSVVATPTAVTDPGRTDRNGQPFGSRHVVKLRIAG